MRRRWKLFLRWLGAWVSIFGAWLTRRAYAEPGQMTAMRRRDSEAEIEQIGDFAWRIIDDRRWLVVRTPSSRRPPATATHGLGTATRTNRPSIRRCTMWRTDTPARSANGRGGTVGCETASWSKRR